MSIKYFLGQLANDEQISTQAKGVREIVFSQITDKEKLDSIIELFANDSEIEADAAQIINISLLCNYGSEYLGIGGDDNVLKLAFYKKLTDKFPNEISFKFKYADVAQMYGEKIELIFPILKSGMLNDKNRKYYPTAELFELIHESKFSFEFDVLLLQNYYQPCDRETFEDYLNDLLEQYKLIEEQEILKGIEWRNNIE